MTSPTAFRNLLAFFLVSAFVAALPLFVFWGMPETSKDIVTYMVGQLSGMATMALGFYFTNKAGQDELDAKRAETTATAFEAVRATANATAGAVTDAIHEGDNVTITKEPGA